jgi:hypothetical protein
MAAYDVLDEALEAISFAAPELANGFTNHAPMTMEALCAVGRTDAVLPWLDKYRKQLIPSLPSHETIPSREWHTSLGQYQLASDWRAFFENELKEASWPVVLDRWTSRLAPGFCAAATHGVIRTGHAARALSISESPTRLAELAYALAYWAATYQTLPTDLSPDPFAKRPAEAIMHVPIIPPNRRQFRGSITSSLEALSGDFAPVINSARLDGDITRVLSELSETFAHVYLANAHDALTATVFVHCVTSVAAVRSLVPHVDSNIALQLTRYAWQSASGIYSVFGSHPQVPIDTDEVSEDYAGLIDKAISNGDEHVIKFTEACARENKLNPSPVYRTSARHVLGVLKSEL